MVTLGLRRRHCTEFYQLIYFYILTLVVSDSIDNSKLSTSWNATKHWTCFKFFVKDTWRKEKKIRFSLFSIQRALAPKIPLQCFRTLEVQRLKILLSKTSSSVFRKVSKRRLFGTTVNKQRLKTHNGRKMKFGFRCFYFNARWRLNFRLSAFGFLQQAWQALLWSGMWAKGVLSEQL